MAPKRKYNADIRYARSCDDFFATDKNGKRILRQGKCVELVKRQMKERGDEETRRMRQILAYTGSGACKKAYGVNVCKLNACT